MDHFATRYPTNVIDIGKFLVNLSSEFVVSIYVDASSTPCNAELKDKKDQALPRIMHFSAPEPYTKYEIVLIFSAILGLPHQHVIADETDPNAGGATTRPRDCKLDTRETEVFIDGVPGGVLGCVGFEEWWRAELTQ